MKRKTTILIYSAFFLLLIGSCKKDNQSKQDPKTYADFEKVMQNDQDFNSFISSSIELENLKYSSYLLPTEDKNKAYLIEKKLNTSELAELKKVKTFGEMRNFLNDHQILNSSKIVEILQKQSISLYNFIKKYPTYGKLSTSEKRSLITNFLNSNDKINYHSQHIGIQNQGQLMLANGDPMQTYGIAIQGCQNSYRTNFTAATAIADIALLASLANPTGIAYVSALVTYAVAVYFLDQERGNCMDLAASLLYNAI